MTAIPSLGSENRGPEVVAVTVVLMVAATLAVALRMLARHVSNLRYGADDFFIVVGIVRLKGDLSRSCKANSSSSLLLDWTPQKSSVVSLRYV